jgi:hypothetical protein
VHAGDGGGGQILEDVVAIAHRVEAVERDGGEAEVASQRRAVDREGGAGQRRGAQRQHVGAGRAGGKPLAVALQHEDVGQQMVGQHDGLRALHVSVAGHRRVHRLGGTRHQGPLHGPEHLVGARGHVSEIESLVERDLVVARAPGVQLAADLAHQLQEPTLHVHVDVFELGPEGERAAGQLNPDGFQPGDDPVALGIGEQAGPRQRVGPRHAAHDVVGP